MEMSEQEKTKKKNVKKPLPKQNDQEPDWEYYPIKMEKEKFADISRYDGLTELAYRLRKLAKMVKKDEQLPELRVQLDEVLSVEPIEIRSLIDLSKTRTLLAKRELDTNDEKPILNEILRARTIVSNEIRNETIKCSLMIVWAQYVNIVRSWRVIIDAKLVNHKSKKQIDTIEELIQQTIKVCQETQRLVTGYMAENNLEAKMIVLGEIEVNYKRIRDGHIKIRDLIDDLKLDVGVGTLRLQYAEFEQDEGLEQNSKRAKKKFTWKFLENKTLIIKPLIFGTAAGLNKVSSKVVEDTKNDLIKLKEKIKELEGLLGEIETARNEAQHFLDNPETFLDDN